MAALQSSTLDAMKKNQSQLLAEWTHGLEASGAARNLKEQDLKQQTSEFLQLIVLGLENGNGQNITAPGWDEIRQFLENSPTAALCLARIRTRPPALSFR